MVNGVSVAVPFEYSYDEERDFRQYTVNSNVCDSFKGFLTEDQIDEMIAFNVKMDNLYFQYNILLEYHFDPVTNTFDSEGHQEDARMLSRTISDMKYAVRIMFVDKIFPIQLNLQMN